MEEGGDMAHFGPHVAPPLISAAGSRIRSDISNLILGAAHPS